MAQEEVEELKGGVYEPSGAVDYSSQDDQLLGQDQRGLDDDPEQESEPWFHCETGSQERGVEIDRANVLAERSARVVADRGREISNGAVDLEPFVGVAARPAPLPSSDQADLRLPSRAPPRSQRPRNSILRGSRNPATPPVVEAPLLVMLPRAP